MKKLSLAFLTLMVSAPAFSAEKETYNCTHKFHSSLIRYESSNPQKVQLDPQDMIGFLTKQKAGQSITPSEVVSYSEGDIVTAVKAKSRNEAISKVLESCTNRTKDLYLNGATEIAKPSNPELSLFTGDIQVLSHLKQHCIYSNKDGLLTMSAQDWGKSESSNRKVFESGKKKSIKEWKAMAKDEPELKDVATRAIEMENKLTFGEYQAEMGQIFEKLNTEIRCEK